MCRVKVLKFWQKWDGKADNMQYVLVIKLAEIADYRAA